MTYASLDLIFINKSNKTNMSHCKHYGSLMVQRALHPEASVNSDVNDICHLMILNPAAGIALGDTLEVKAKLHTNTHAVLTTTGAGKWYGKGKSHIGDTVDARYFKPDTDSTTPNIEADKDVGIQTINIELAENSKAEWIPQENIIFDDANIKAITEFTLAPTSSLLTWDILVLGRQAYDEKFENGYYANEFIIKRLDESGKSTPIVYEVVNQSADSRWFKSPLGMYGQHVMGTFWAIPTTENVCHLNDTIEQLREHIEQQSLPVVCTATDQGVCIRYLGDDVRACFTAFSQLRHVIRKIWWEVEAYEPRIWHT